MGLIQAALGAAGGALADQWKEFFYCDALDANTLAVKGSKRTTRRSSNVRGEDNIITDQSVFAVADGQVLIIVEQGAVVEVVAQPGQYVFSGSASPTMFAGDFQSSASASLQDIMSRFSFGGQPGRDQRVYYLNTKEIVGNKFGTASPVPFRVVDRNIGLDVDISVRCNGQYSYRIVDPVLFYKNVCGNISSSYKRSQLDSQLKSEFLTALQPAFAQISEEGVRYSAVPGHAQELADAMNKQLSDKWVGLRGIQVASVGINAISASPEDERMIKDLQKAATMRDPTMAAAQLTAAQADAMRTAAANQGGAAVGFMGMNMAQQAGGMNLQGLYQMGQQHSPAANNSSTWTCPKCGYENTGRFCQECGTPRPVAHVEWICPKCGKRNSGKFCPDCGSPRPSNL